MLNMKDMTKQELLAYIELQQANNAAGLIVKVTEKGGVYIRHDSFLEYSAAKEKDYVAGINLGYKTAKALFGNPALLKQVIDSVSKL